MRSLKLFLIAAFALLVADSAKAALVSVNGVVSLRGDTAAIIANPADVTDGAAGANALGQRGFNEVQNFLLPVDITLDGGVVIMAGTVISSHMIFLNNSIADSQVLNRHLGVEWTFDGNILGVMSDYNGFLEVATNPLLGALGTIYPVAGFQARGIESDDSYSFLLNVLTFNSNIRQPGDWIRVITLSSGGNPIPEPATALLLGGAGLLGAMRRRSRKSA